MYGYLLRQEINNLEFCLFYVVVRLSRSKFLELQSSRHRYLVKALQILAFGIACVFYINVIDSDKASEFSSYWVLNRTICR